MCKFPPSRLDPPLPPTLYQAPLSSIQQLNNSQFPRTFSMKWIRPNTISFAITRKSIPCQPCRSVRACSLATRSLLAHLLTTSPLMEPHHSMSRLRQPSTCSKILQLATVSTCLLFQPIQVFPTCLVNHSSDITRPCSTIRLMPI